jgi:hypothetical protein
MPGKIFYRERRKMEEGEKKPRFVIAAYAETDLVVYAKHYRLSELQQMAAALGAELIELKADEPGHKMKDDE